MKLMKKDPTFIIKRNSVWTWLMSCYISRAVRFPSVSVHTRVQCPAEVSHTSFGRERLMLIQWRIHYTGEWNKPLKQVICWRIGFCSTGTRQLNMRRTSTAFSVPSNVKIKPAPLSFGSANVISVCVTSVVSLRLFISRGNCYIHTCRIRLLYNPLCYNEK